MDFGANSELLQEVADKINDAADTIESLATDITNGIKGLGEYWEGESYTAFSAKCEEYAPAMDALVNVLRACSKICSEQVLAGDYSVDDLVSDVKEELSM